MKNWIVFIIVFLLALTIVISTTVVIQARKPFAEAEKTAEEFMLKEEYLSSVTESYVYRGLSSYVTVFGYDEDGDAKAVFLTTVQDEDDVVEVFLEEGISKAEAIGLVKAEMNVKKILHAKLGIEEVGPVWEVSYVGQNDKLNYVYILFDNGNWWKRILNL